MNSSKPPKYTRATIDKVNDTFIVKDGLFYNYYPIKVSIMIPGKVLKIDVSPPLIADGYIVFKKKIYQVNKKDILRRKFHVSREHRPKPIESECNIRHINEPRPEQIPQDEVLQDANLAWEEQIRALQHMVNPEEIWWCEDDSWSR